MTLPEFKKSWQISPNNALAAQLDALTTNRTALLNIVNAITGGASYNLNGDVGAGTFDWYEPELGAAVASPVGFAAIRYTSNGVAVSSLGVNNVALPGDVIFAGSTNPRTWWIIDLGGVEVLITCNATSTNGNTLGVYASSYGNTGNRFVPVSHTADPIAVGSYTIMAASTAWGGSASTNAPLKLHFWVSADGEAFEVMVCNGGKTNTCFRVEKPVTNSVDYTDPSVVYFKGAVANTSVVTESLMHTNENLFTYAEAQATSFGLDMPYIGGSTARSLATAPNAISGEWDMFAQHLAKRVAPVQGVHGELHDVWWAPVGVVVTNISASDADYPAGRLACVGDQWRPWVPGKDFEAA